LDGADESLEARLFSPWRTRRHRGLFRKFGVSHAREEKPVADIFSIGKDDGDPNTESNADSSFVIGGRERRCGYGRAAEYRIVLLHPSP
jgi:hypothetical protein